MKKLLMLLLAIVCVLGLSACTYEATYTIHEDGSVDIEAMPWYSIDDMKQILALEMQWMTSAGQEIDAESQAKIDAINNIQTIDEMVEFIKASDDSGTLMDEIVIKEINGVSYIGDPNEKEKDTYPAEYVAETQDQGFVITPDTFEFSTEGMLNTYSELMGGSGITGEDADAISAMLSSTNFLLTIEMPDEIAFTNGELSKDKKSVFFNINLSTKNQKYYAYTKSSKGIIDLGLEDGAVTKKKSIKVSTPDKLTSLTVNGEKVSGKKIDLSQDGEYTVTAKTKNAEKTITFIKDSTKPVVTGVKNGKTYTGSVTIKFSDELSGIKSAKLGKKKVKSGVKVSKAGTYTLKVTDKAGNKTTVKFTIK